MDGSVDTYLHKKFKKQLTIDPKPQQYDKENKVSSKIAEQSEEKASKTVIECSQNWDNNVNVPNQSTNQNSLTVVSVSEVSKSSISTKNLSGNSQSLNPCISYVVSNNKSNENNFCKTVSFDTTFRTSEATKPSSSTSSIINEYVYHNQSHLDREREVLTPPPLEEYSTREENENKSEYKSEEAQPTPDKSTSGKYVCTYCNLVCSKPSVLQKHIRAHTNERPYPCTSCGFSFKTRSNLYKHCRSRTHANRVMGNKAQEATGETEISKHNYTNNATQTHIYPVSSDDVFDGQSKDFKNKPYKPRFHTKSFVDADQKESVDDERHFSGNELSHKINEIISKNNSIVNSSDPSLLKKRYAVDTNVDSVNNNEYTQRFQRTELPNLTLDSRPEEPLNLTNKNRKRCMSEIAEPVIQKSLIKELLLKNLYSDMQCPYCKMIFQTVTELELHKLRSCKGKPSEAKYTRSSSVNVASILTKNKNAFDGMPAFQNQVFPLNSPGPFLGKTRLVESDKNKSFSFDSVNLPLPSPNEISPSYMLSPLQFKEEKKAPIRLFGGEVQIHDSAGETKSFIIDNKDKKPESESNFIDYSSKLSENRLVKSSLQSGGTVLTNKTSKEESRPFKDIIRVYENTSVSPNIDMTNLGKSQFNFEKPLDEKSLHSNSIFGPILRESPLTSQRELPNPSHKYTDISDFSQNAVKLLTPNLKQPTISISGIISQNMLSYNVSSLCNSTSSAIMHSPKLRPEFDRKMCSSPIISIRQENEVNNAPQLNKPCIIQKPLEVASSPNSLYNPVNLLVNGKVVRYVPGIPGPVAADGPIDMIYGRGNPIVAVGRASKEISTSLEPSALLDRIPVPEKTNSPRLSPSVHKNFLSIEKLTEKISTSENIEPKFDNRPKMTEMKSPTKIPEQKGFSKDYKPISTESSSEPKKFARPNSLALKPTTASLKQHHGLTPTIFNKILISPDTPRVAKKVAQHYLNGNYFTYLGLKSSTKPTYCTLNKTQPFYVPHFKKLSMYSEWRQQDTKTDKLYVSAYDSRQKNQRYSTAGKTVADLIIHSSYKFVITELPSKQNEENLRSNPNESYDGNDESPYIRGRGRGKYVCEQCGIRCKKPSMLKKHIRTHSNDRPYTCSHCNFSFKTKGNLTKHMKSKSHLKTYTAGTSPSTLLSVSQSSDSDTDDSGMDSSDESMTRHQEHEAAYGLLSLSQKTTVPSSPSEMLSPSGIIQTGNSAPSNDQFMTTEAIAYVTKTNYAKNKFLDNLNFKPSKEIVECIAASSCQKEKSKENESLSIYLGKTTTTRLLTYPYTSILPTNELSIPMVDEPKIMPEERLESAQLEPKGIKQFHVIQKYAPMPPKTQAIPVVAEKDIHSNSYPVHGEMLNYNPLERNSTSAYVSTIPTLKVNDVVVQDNPIERKRKISVIETNYKSKIHKNDEVMDLSMPTSEKRETSTTSDNGILIDCNKYVSYNQHKTNSEHLYSPNSPQSYNTIDEHQTDVEERNYRNSELTREFQNNRSIVHVNPLYREDAYGNPDTEMHNTSSSDAPKIMDYDNSAMETLADVATKQVKLEKNTLAKSVASEFLKLATQNENLDTLRDTSNFVSLNNKDVNDLIVKPEGNKSCTICSKSFNKPFQLRLHMNIHYLERPFRCDSCSVSFRSKGHLQKHERSASHYSKLSSSPAQSSSEPRPFKCSDCNIAFRIHGHLAKHLRSKMHIMKLECLAKIPFGLYAELERSNSLLTEINTSDGDQCLESLKTLAKKVFINDPSKLQSIINHIESETNIEADS